MAQRTAWTDERLDDKMATVDSSFDRLHLELTEFRAEMREGFQRLDTRVDRLQDRLVQIGFGLAAAQFTTLITVVITIVLST